MDSVASFLKLTALNAVRLFVIIFSTEGSLGDDIELLLLLPDEDVKLFVCTKKLDSIWISFIFSQFFWFPESISIATEFFFESNISWLFGGVFTSYSSYFKKWNQYKSIIGEFFVRINHGLNGLLKFKNSHIIINFPQGKCTTTRTPKRHAFSISCLQ